MCMVRQIVLLKGKEYLKMKNTISCIFAQNKQNGGGIISTK